MRCQEGVRGVGGVSALTGAVDRSWRGAACDARSLANSVSSLQAEPDIRCRVGLVIFGVGRCQLAQDGLTGSGGGAHPAAAVGGHLINRLREKGLELSVRRY